jgi:hypothetical protein
MNMHMSMSIDIQMGLLMHIPIRMITSTNMALDIIMGKTTYTRTRTNTLILTPTPTERPVTATPSSPAALNDGPWSYVKPFSAGMIGSLSEIAGSFAPAAFLC